MDGAAMGAVAGCTAAGGQCVVVYLVHGTWPEGIVRALGDTVKRVFGKDTYRSVSGNTCWFQNDHPFRKELEKGLVVKGFKPDIRTFVWNGANSFRSRESAAAALAQQLSQGLACGVRQIVIAHSHGGTVALRALELMPTGAEQIEVVTLASPFLRVEAFGSSKPLGTAVSLSLFLLFCVIGVWSAWRYGQSAVDLVLFSVAVVLGLIARGIGTMRAFVKKHIIDRQPGRFLGARILCIRGMADEADMGISLGIIGCNVIRTLVVLYGKLLSRASTFLMVSGYLALIGVMTYALVAEHPETIRRWIVCVGAVALGLIVLVGVASLLQGALGVELAFAGFNVLTTVESSPDAARDRIEVVTLVATHDSSEGLRHAVYLHAECIPKILESI
jgi:hypothetical protein